MGLIFAIIIGLVVGAIGGYFVRENFDFIIIDSLLGVAGAITGDALYFVLSGNGFLLFSWFAIILEIICAVLVVMLFGLLHKNVPEK